MATDCHGLPQAEAHRRFEQSQHRDLKATFIYNLASAYDRIDRYKRLQEGEKAPRSASLQKGSSPRMRERQLPRPNPSSLARAMLPLRQHLRRSHAAMNTLIHDYMYLVASCGHLDPEWRFT